ncbi:hypothetical protein D3C87_1017240 [compost metagenome]
MTEELTFEEAWAMIELLDVIEYDAREASGLLEYSRGVEVEYAATIPILKPGHVLIRPPPGTTVILPLQSGIWACAKTWYYHETRGSTIPHETKEQAKRDIRRRFKATYKTSERFRKAVNEFLRGADDQS